MKRYFLGVGVLTRAYLLRFFRDKTALFFTFLFPLLFLFVFGTLNSGGGDVSFKVALLNKSDSPFSQQFEKQLRSSDTFKVNESITTSDQATERMSRGEIDTIIELPDTFGDLNAAGKPAGAVTVYYSQSNPQSGQTVAAVMEQVVNKVNTELGQPAPPLSVEQKSTNTAGLSNFDYVFAGLLGFTILSLGIFGLANQMPAEKKTGAFRRLRASPLHASQLIFANMAYYLIVGLISLTLMFVIATIFFDFSMQGNWFYLIIVMLLGIMLMFGFGLAIGGYAKNENQSAALTNIVALPLMFLSGVFFPRFLMPEWLQGITAYLPLTPIIDSFRLIMTEAKTLIDLLPQLGLIAVWLIVVYIVAIRVFRWE